MEKNWYAFWSTRSIFRNVMQVPVSGTSTTIFEVPMLHNAQVSDPKTPPKKHPYSLPRKNSVYKIHKIQNITITRTYPIYKGGFT